MNITIINDCRDDNAVGRQLARAQSLFGTTPAFVGVKNDIEASGNLVDVLDVYRTTPSVILVNVAPRQHVQTKWQNGTPFGYVRIGKTLVVSSIDGHTLSLPAQMGIIGDVTVLDIPALKDTFVAAGLMDDAHGAYMAETQFRSLDFLPFAGAYLIAHGDLPGEVLTVANIESVPLSAWWIDNFGNAKLTEHTTEGVDLPARKDTPFGSFPVFQQLRDVPDGTSAIVVGSSGYGPHRFLEIVTQGGDAAKRHAISTGASSVAL